MITVRVTHPSGLQVPYSVDPLLPAKYLLDLADQDRNTKMCFDGAVLNRDLSLKCQGVGDKDHIILYKRVDPPEVEQQQQSRNSRLQNVYSLMKEAMRIDDVNMMRLEEYGETGMEEDEEEEAEPPMENGTVTGGVHMVASEPLPILWKEETVPESYDVPLRPYFSSIEETGKFLMKQIQDEWTW